MWDSRDGNIGSRRRKSPSSTGEKLGGDAQEARERSFGTANHGGGGHSPGWQQPCCRAGLVLAFASVVVYFENMMLLININFYEICRTTSDNFPIDSLSLSAER